MINQKKSQTKLGEAVYLEFVICQDQRDEELLVTIKEFLGCGNVYKNRTWRNFCVTKLEDITTKIIPFFEKHRIRGVKALDFKDFCLVASMLKDKKHLGSPPHPRLRLSFPLSEYLFSPFLCRSLSPFLDRGKGKERNSERGKDRQRKGEKEVFRRRAVPPGGPPPFEL